MGAEDSKEFVQMDKKEKSDAVKKVLARKLAKANRELAKKRKRKIVPCPKCRKRMAVGYAKVHGKLLDSAIVGWSHQYLWFYDELTDSGHEVLACLDAARAYHCYKCGLTLIMDKKR